MRTEKPYKKVGKCDFKKTQSEVIWFKNIDFRFLMEIYEESIASNILTQIWVSYDDFTSNYSEKCERYATNINHIESHPCR